MKKTLFFLFLIFISFSCSDSDDGDNIEDLLTDEVTTTVATLNTEEGNHDFVKLIHQHSNTSDLKNIAFHTNDYSKSLNIGIWYASYEGGKNRITMSFNDGTVDTNDYPNLYSYDSSFPPDDAPEDIINFTILEDTETNFKASFNGVLHKEYTLTNGIYVYETLNITETIIDITF